MNAGQTISVTVTSPAGLTLAYIAIDAFHRFAGERWFFGFFVRLEDGELCERVLYALLRPREKCGDLYVHSPFALNLGNVTKVFRDKFPRNLHRLQNERRRQVAILLPLDFSHAGRYTPSTMRAVLWSWLQASEPIAVWLEAIALIAIFFLDWKVRKDNRQDQQVRYEETAAQMAVSQKQVELSQDQVEATLRPCVSLSMGPREMEAAILAANETDSTVVVRCPEGLVQIENMGVGPAINIRYKFSTVQPHESTYPHPTGYVAGIPKEGVFLIPVARTLLAGHDYESLIEYESVGHRKYRTRVTLSNLVITDMRFEIVPQQD